ncbi:MAG: DAK2 domain-containing protein [Candidatus Neomarinimicrobiota bacterium]
MKIKTFVSSLEGGLDYFKANYHTIDNLNVFPVPDGDTGINMLLTFQPAVEAVKEKSDHSFESVLKVLCEEATMNSRGNSGFILSRFIAGFSEVVIEQGDITIDILSEAFDHGHFISKTSVSTPRDGTMLSVFEAIAKAMKNAQSNTVLEHFVLAVEAGRQEVFISPEKLPVLKKAGVVDSGALGFVFLLEGMRRKLAGEGIKIEDEAEYRFEPAEDANIEEMMEIQNRYCTELLIRRDTTPVGRDIEQYLNKMGDSVAFLMNENIIKLHVHTNEPEKLVNELAVYGDIENKKIEDMQKQMEEEFSRFQHVNEMGVLALVPGDGFRSILHELEPDLDVLVYNKNLPNTGDILNHVNKMPYDVVIVLANDKNIIPAVQLAKQESPKHIKIFPSKNVIQGLAALMGFVKNAKWEENLTQMTDSMELVDSIAIYKSIKDSKFAGIKIPRDHFFALMNGDVVSVSEKLKPAVVEAITCASPEERMTITSYYNGKVTEAEIEEIYKSLREEYEDVEFESRYGGQHTALLLIGLE